MPYPQFDRMKLNIKLLKERPNKVKIERDHIPLSAKPKSFNSNDKTVLDKTIE